MLHEQMDRLRNPSQQSDSQLIELESQKQFNSQMLARNKRKQPVNQNSISQQVAGLSKIIDPNAVRAEAATGVNDNQRRSMNKTLMYLR